jgi:chromosomal replication initiation ATPase DnaA
MGRKKIPEAYVIPGLKKTRKNEKDNTQRAVADYADMVALMDFLTPLVANHFSITVEELRHSKKYMHTRPSQLTIWLARQVSRFSWQWLAEYFFYSDRAGAYRACKLIDAHIRNREPEKDDADTLLPVVKQWVREQENKRH